MILLIPFIFSFKINKVNTFLASTTPFLSNLFIAFEVRLITNPGKLSLAKGITVFVSAFFPKLPNQVPKDLPDWNILDLWFLLCVILLTYYYQKHFLINLFVFLLEIIHVVILHLQKFPYLVLKLFLSFFRCVFNLFKCVFVSLTLASW